MTEDDQERLEDGFDTSSLLRAVDAVDLVRRALANDEDGKPPTLRMDLLRLHELATDVVNEGDTARAEEMFDLADELDMQVFELTQALETVQDALETLTDLRPEDRDDEDKDD